jgi:hypothetical protein
MISTKRALFDAIVTEVEADIPLIKVATPTSYIEAVENSDDKFSLDEKDDVVFHSPISAFSDYAVRDAVMLKAVESEEFAYILLNKLANRLYQNQEGKDDGDTLVMNQEEVEVLAVLTHLGVLWNQVQPAMNFAMVMSKVLEVNKELEVPSLHTLTERIVERVLNDAWDFEVQRKDMVLVLKDKSLAGLDE